MPPLNLPQGLLVHDYGLIQGVLMHPVPCLKGSLTTQCTSMYGTDMYGTDMHVLFFSVQLTLNPRGS
jgi:hypothetical protein